MVYISMYHKQRSMSKIELDLKRFAAYKKGKFREKMNKVTIKCLNLIFLNPTFLDIFLTRAYENVSHLVVMRTFSKNTFLITEARTSVTGKLT